MISEVTQQIFYDMSKWIALYIVTPIFVLMLALLPKFTKSGDFCDGWDDGYCEGYKSVEGQQRVCPIAPSCPVPEADGDTYSRGFARGYEKGKEDAE